MRKLRCWLSVERGPAEFPEGLDIDCKRKVEDDVKVFGLSHAFIEILNKQKLKEESTMYNSNPCLCIVVSYYPLETPTE